MRCDFILGVKRFSAAEIHRELCQVHGPTVKSEERVRQWSRRSQNVRETVHDEERSDRTSIPNDEIVEEMN